MSKIGALDRDPEKTLDLPPGVYLDPGPRRGRDAASRPWRRSASSAHSTSAASPISSSSSTSASSRAAASPAGSACATCGSRRSGSPADERTNTASAWRSATSMLLVFAVATLASPGSRWSHTGGSSNEPPAVRRPHRRLHGGQRRDRNGDLSLPGAPSLRPRAVSIGGRPGGILDHRRRSSPSDRPVAERAGDRGGDRRRRWSWSRGDVCAPLMRQTLSSSLRGAMSATTSPGSRPG